MKYYILALSLLTGCATVTQSRKQHLMVHDYVIDWANHLCEGHEGLHYIVPMSTPITKGSWAPMCEDLFRIRCQDEYLIEFDAGEGCCDCVSKMQWDETMKDKPKEKVHL